MVDLHTFQIFRTFSLILFAVTELIKIGRLHRIDNSWEADSRQVNFWKLQYGLYSSFMGCFVYLVFGSCKDITVGPTAIMALLSQQHVIRLGEDIAVSTLQRFFTWFFTRLPCYLLSSKILLPYEKEMRYVCRMKWILKLVPPQYLWTMYRVFRLKQTARETCKQFPIAYFIVTRMDFFSSLILSMKTWKTVDFFPNVYNFLLNLVALERINIFKNLYAQQQRNSFSF